MKRAALLALFLVTWKTFAAVRTKAPVIGGPECDLDTQYHQEEFFDWFKAAARATAIKVDPANFDVSLWKLEDVQPVKK